MWAMQYIQCEKPRTFITSGGLGTMGYGVPAAVGAKAARPDAIVGHFMFPGGEAARRAARSAKVPYAVVAHGQDVVNAELAPLLRRRTQRVLDEAGLLVAVSQPLADRPCPNLNSTERFGQASGLTWILGRQGE